MTPSATTPQWEHIAKLYHIVETLDPGVPGSIPIVIVGGEMLEKLPSALAYTTMMYVSWKNMEKYCD